MIKYSAEDLLQNPVMFQEFVNSITAAVTDASQQGGSDAVGDTYTLGATDGDGIVTLNLDAATGTDSNVVFEGGTDISVNYTDDKLIISYTAGGEEGNYVEVDTATGAITDGTNTFQYLYQYLHTRFSASSNGASFVVDPNDITGSTIYIGLANSSSMTAPTEASSYNWTEFTWSSTHNVFYRTTGGNRIDFLTSTQSSVGDAVLFASGDSPIDFNVLMINTGNLVDAAITTTKILDNAITTPKIVANAITSVKITADAITTDKIAANAVTATEIATDAITADKVVAGAITADKLTIVASEIPGATYLNKIEVDADNLGGQATLIANQLVFITFGGWLMYTDQDSDQGQNQGTPYTNGDDWSDIKQIRERAVNNNVGFSNNDGFVFSYTSATQWCIYAVEVLFENGTDNVSAYNVLGIVDYAGTIPNRGTSPNLQFATTLRGLGGVSSELDTGLQASDFGPSGTTVIDGGRITTGTLSADRISAGSLDVDKIDASSGNFDVANIPDLNASKITAGTINADRIAAGSITTAKIDATSAAFDVALIPDLNASKITAGTIDADRIATNSITIGKIDQTSGTFDTDTIPDLSANKITSGILNATLIQDGTITTNKINATSGTFATANIPDLNANKITTGSLDADRIAASSISTAKIDATSAAFDVALIPDLNASKITAGTLDANLIAAGSITTNKIDATSGTFASANIPNLSADKITSGTIDVGLLAADTAYITNSAQVGDGVIIAGNIGNDAVTSTQIADGAITTSAIAAGAISADKINAGTITADKLILDGNVLEADGSNLTVKDKAITSELIGDSEVGAVNIAANAITADAIAANSVTADAISVANLAAISATLGNVDIDSARINSGVINTARIPNLDANKITSGTIDANRLNISNTDVSGLGALATQDTVAISEIPGIEYVSKLDIDSDSLGGGTVTIDADGVFITFGEWLMYTDQDTDQGNNQGTPYVNGDAWADILQIRERGTPNSIGFSNNDGFVFVHTSDTQWAVYAVEVLFENGTDNVSAYNVLGLVDSMGVTLNRGTTPNLQFATTLKGLGGVSVVLDTGITDADLALKVNVDLTNAPAGILNSNVEGQTKASLGVNTIYNQDLLPSVGVLIGDVWYDTNDSDKQYVAQVNAPTIIGDNGWKLFDPNANINNSSTTIDGGKITTGTLNADRVNASSGVFAVANIPDLNANKITAGTIDAARISITASNVTDLGDLATEDNVTQSQVTGLADTFNTKVSVDLTNAPASILNSNVTLPTKSSLGVNSVFSQDNIPTGAAGDIWFDTNDSNKQYVAQVDGSNEISPTEWLLFDPGANINNTTTTIDGGKITTGTLNTDRLNASSAVIATALIPDLNANKITTGTLNAGRISAGSLDVDKIDATSGAFNTANIPNLAVGKITGLGGLATKNSVDTDEIDSGAVTSIKIGDTLQSDNYSQNSAGWRIHRDTGNAEFNDIDIRGDTTLGNTITAAFAKNTLTLPSDTALEGDSFTYSLTIDGTTVATNRVVDFEVGVAPNNTLAFGILFGTSLIDVYTSYENDGVSVTISTQSYDITTIDLSISAINLNGNTTVPLIAKGIGTGGVDVLTVRGDTTFLGNVCVDAPLEVTQETTFKESVNVKKNVDVTGDITLGGQLRNDQVITNSGNFSNASRISFAVTDSLAAIYPPTGTGITTKNIGSTNLPWTDVITQRIILNDGTAVSPSLTNNGDINTGIYFPAADQLGITTGGGERINISSNNTTLNNQFVVGQLGSNSATSGSGYRISTAEQAIHHHNSTLMFLNKTETSGNVIQFYNSGTFSGGISVNGNATSYNTSSDYRLKENIVPLSDGLTRLNQLEVKRFNFITDTDKIVDGFIAHEVSEVVPEAIHGVKDEVDTDGNPVYQGIDQSKLVPLLVAAVQDLSEQLNNQPTHIQAQHAIQIQLNNVINGSTIFIDGGTIVKPVSVTESWHFKAGLWSYYNGWRHNGDFSSPAVVHEFT